jgi:hypothetical protein
MEKDDQLMAVLSELIEVAASRATHQPASPPASQSLTYSNMSQEAQLQSMQILSLLEIRQCF